MTGLRRCALPFAVVLMSFSFAPGLLVPAGSPAGAAAACDVNVGGGVSPLPNIQAGIDAATTGKTVCVYPGLYNTEHASSRNPNTGGAGSNDFNIFVGSNATNVTIQGVDTLGNAIVTAPQGATPATAPVIQAAGVYPTFGSSNMFIQADNVTLRGFEINGTPNDIAKSVEIVGNGDTVNAVAFAPSTVSGGVGIYISDFNFNVGLNSSTVKSYSFSNNTFDGDGFEEGIYLASGAGWSGPVSGRVISGNKFTGMDDAMDFAGPTSTVPWLQYPVGTATITGNTFSNIRRRHVLVFGDGGPGVGYVSPNWCGIISGNTFDRGSFIWQGATVCPSGTARTWAASGFTNVAGLYSAIQPYGITKSLAGDTVQVLAGTYDEALTIDHSLTLLGANAGVAGTGARGPESLVERLAAESGPAFNITTTNPVTIDGFKSQFNGTDAVGGVLLSTGAGNTLTFRNNIVNNSTYSNVLVYNTSAATSTFTNNLFDNDDTTNPGCTGVVGAWGSSSTQAVVNFTGNTFSNFTDGGGGCPAINFNNMGGVVTGNTFENIHEYGILLADNLGNLSITNNLFDNIHNDTLGNQNRGSGIRTFQNPTFVGPVNVNHNTFSNDAHGVRVANDGSPADLSSGNFVVNRNAFTTDSSDGISVDPATTGVLNGTCNWWGSASGPSDAGPGTGTGVTSGVNFAPVLLTSNLDGFCGVAPPVIGAVASHGTDGISVSFTPGPDGGSPFTSFTATCVSLAGQGTITATGSGSPIIVTGAVSGTPYSCTVTETNAVGTSGPSGASAIVFPATLPGGGGGGGGSGSCTVAPTAPRSPTAASESFPGAAVSWAAPLSGCIAGYIVTPYLNGVAQTPTLVPGKGTTTVIRGLIAGGKYTFTVAAENGIVAGPASVMTASVTIGAPAAASAVKAAKAGKGSLKISFLSARNNGAAVKSYTATCTSSNGGKTKTKSGAKSPLTVTGLSAGHVYRCTVKATNSRGTGPQSGASAAVKA